MVALARSIPKSPAAPAFSDASRGCALVVGSILTSINHGDMILSGEYPYWLKIVLTYCVPYCVTTWGAITGKLARLKKVN